MLLELQKCFLCGKILMSETFKKYHENEDITRKRKTKMKIFIYAL